MHAYLLEDINDLIIQIKFKTLNGRNKDEKDNWRDRYCFLLERPSTEVMTVIPKQIFIDFMQNQDPQ